jgi:hypothetical protein
MTRITGLKRAVERECHFVSQRREVKETCDKKQPACESRNAPWRQGESAPASAAWAKRHPYPTNASAQRVPLPQPFCEGRWVDERAAAETAAYVGDGMPFCLGRLTAGTVRAVARG